MKLPITYIFQPAQAFVVRVATPAKESTRRRRAAADDNGGQDCLHCAMRDKYRARSKFRRGILQILQLEAV